MRAATWYDRRAPGLGDRLLDEVAERLQLLKERPTSRPPVPVGSFERSLLSTFPYSLIYRVEANEVVIIAVAHYKRRLGYWRRRKPET